MYGSGQPYVWQNISITQRTTCNKEGQTCMTQHATCAGLHPENAPVWLSLSVMKGKGRAEYEIFCTLLCRVGQNCKYTVFMAGKSPDKRSYTVYVHDSGQPYSCVFVLCLHMSLTSGGSAAACTWTAEKCTLLHQKISLELLSSGERGSSLHVPTKLRISQFIPFHVLMLRRRSAVEKEPDSSPQNVTTELSYYFIPCFDVIHSMFWCCAGD